MTPGQPSEPASAGAFLGRLQLCEHVAVYSRNSLQVHCLCVTNKEDSHWHLVMTTRLLIGVTQNHPDPAPVPGLGQALWMMLFFWHFASGEMEAKNS